MLPGSKLTVFLLLGILSEHIIDQLCLCSALLSVGLKANCSSLNLRELPPLPSDTTELYVQDNRLTSVSPGLFDRMLHLKKASLSGNAFHCDCRIQYLRNWLLKNRAIVIKEPTCASPSSVADKAITELSDDYFSSCALAGMDGTYDTVIGVMLCCIVVLLLWSLRLAKNSTITLCIDERHTGLEVDSLRSLKPKHRTWRYTASDIHDDLDSLNFVEDLESSIINMEILPQVLDVLHKRNIIKTKGDLRDLFVF